MKTRIITAVVALAVFVGVLLAPPVVFPIALAAVILCMIFECASATKADWAMKVTAAVSSVLLIASMAFVFTIDNLGLVFVFMAATAIVLLYMALVVYEHGKRSYKDILSNGFLTLYITVSMWCLAYTREFFSTPQMLLIFICAWSCDTFAYFTGKFFGKRKLIPHISPNKTVAGAVGGVIGAAVCCALFSFIVKKIPSYEFSVGEHYIFISAAIGLIGGALSQLGDLIASSVKRDEGIKDFGKIFPGHGGFMDRFDSVMYIAPVILMIMVGAMLFIN